MSIGYKLGKMPKVHLKPVEGARTITVNGELCQVGSVYVDPSGYVVHNGTRFSGRGTENE